jgi:SET domain
VGLYHPANFINHSCRPNAIQTFLFQQGQLPSLHVTSFEDIGCHEEICISYTDTSCPTHIRQEQLSANYFFDCLCDTCFNILDDSRKFGIQCPSCKKGPVVSIESMVKPAHPAGRTAFHCQECGRTDFDSTLELLQSFEQEYQNNFQKHFTMGPRLERYQELKDKCRMTSWYVQEAGEQRLQSHLDRLSEQSGNPSGEQDAAWRALQLAEELLQPTKDDDIWKKLSTSEFLRVQQLRYKAAKLRLFVLPDPRQSIHELQEILSSMSRYYPKEHELILGLQDTLQGAMV